MTVNDHQQPTFEGKSNQQIFQVFMHLASCFLINGRFLKLAPARKSAPRSDGRRTVVGGARVVSGAEKKSLDRGGPVWPPRSNVTNDRLRGQFGDLQNGCYYHQNKKKQKPEFFNVGQKIKKNNLFFPKIRGKPIFSMVF